MWLEVLDLGTQDSRGRRRQGAQTEEKKGQTKVIKRSGKEEVRLAVTQLQSFFTQVASGTDGFRPTSCSPALAGVDVVDGKLRLGRWVPPASSLAFCILCFIFYFFQSHCNSFSHFLSILVVDDWFVGIWSSRFPI
jgi:hypothetical protein